MFGSTLLHDADRWKPAKIVTGNYEIKCICTCICLYMFHKYKITIGI